MSKNKIDIILPFAAITLALLYLLSFVKELPRFSDKREKIKTSLVNPKYKDQLSDFELTDSTGILELKKNGNFWIVSQIDAVSQKSSDISLPVSQERLENFINNLITVRNLYKLSDKVTQNDSFGLTNGTEFHIRYNSGDAFHDLAFGNQDFALTSRYLMTEKNTTVYEIDDSLDVYLTTSAQSWTEPYIISRIVSDDNKKLSSDDVQSGEAMFYENGVLSGYSKQVSDIEKLMDLRHGGLPSVEEIQTADLEDSNLSGKIILELGNKKQIILKIYDISKNQDIVSYLVNAQYYNQNSQMFYQSYSKISDWTYNKIKETTLYKK